MANDKEEKQQRQQRFFHQRPTVGHSRGLSEQEAAAERHTPLKGLDGLTAFNESSSRIRLENRSTGERGVQRGREQQGKKTSNARSKARKTKTKTA